MGMIYLGVTLVIGGAAMMLVSYHSRGPDIITNGGTVIALFGFFIYIFGRIQHRKTRETGLEKDSFRNEDEP